MGADHASRPRNGAAARALTAAGVGAWQRERGTELRQASVEPSTSRTPFVILAEAETPDRPVEWEPHAHLAHELVWARGGTLTTRVHDRVFTMSEGFGLWIPAGAVHAGRLTAGIVFRNAYFAPEHTPVAFDGPMVIAMSPMLESLLIHLARTDLAAGARARAEVVVFDVLEPSDRPLALQLPGDPRIDGIAEVLLADPSDRRDLAEWARALGISERTISRAFRSSTGLSFSDWRQTLRIHRALVLLGDGFDVSETAEQLGYTYPSTFISAFRRVLGMTPGAYGNSR